MTVTLCRVMMTEAYSPIEKQMLYYGNKDGSVIGAHFTFNFLFITSLTKDYTVDDVVKAIRLWLNNIPSQYTSNWVVSGIPNKFFVIFYSQQFSAGEP